MTRGIIALLWVLFILGVANLGLTFYLLDYITLRL